MGKRIGVKIGDILLATEIAVKGKSLMSKQYRCFRCMRLIEPIWTRIPGGDYRFDGLRKCRKHPGCGICELLFDVPAE